MHDRVVLKMTFKKPLFFNYIQQFLFSVRGLIIHSCFPISRGIYAWNLVSILLFYVHHLCRS